MPDATGGSYAGEIRIRSRIDTDQLSSDAAKIQAQMDKVVHKMREAGAESRQLGLEQAFEKAQAATRKYEAELDEVRAKLTEIQNDTTGDTLHAQTEFAAEQLNLSEQQLIEIQKAMEAYRDANPDYASSGVYRQMQADLTAEIQTARARDALYRDAEAREERYVAKRQRQIESLTAQESALSEKVEASKSREALAEQRIIDAREKQQNRLSELGTEYGRLNHKLDETVAKEQASADTAEKASQKITVGTKSMTRHAHASGNAFQALGKRIAGLAKRVFIFSVITTAFRKMRQFISQVAQVMPELRTSLAEIKGALLTAFQPLWEVVQPLLVSFLRWLARALTTVAGMISAIFGKSLQSSAQHAQQLHAQMNDVGDAAGKTQKAVRKLNKELAGFDEIVQLSGNSLADGALGSISSGSGGSILPIFPTDGFSSFLQKFESWIARIKNSPAFKRLVQMLDRLKEKWDDFVRSGALEKVESIIGSIAAILADIVLIWLASGAEILGDIVELIGHILDGDWWAVIDDIKDIWIDWKFAPLEAVAAIMDDIFGTDMLSKVQELKDALKDFDPGQWLQDSWADIKEVWNTNIKPKLTELKGKLEGAGQWIDENVFKVIWDQYEKWGFQDAVKSTWESIKTTLRPAATWFKENLLDPIGKFVKEKINYIIDKINYLIRQFNDKIHIEIPEWAMKVLGYSGGSMTFQIPEIPRLARGAVIPPNAPFLAMLGDQKSGTNIEAPLDTIVEAFKRAQTTQPVTIRFDGSLAQLGRVLQPVIERENRRLGPQFVTTTGGATV